MPIIHKPKVIIIAETKLTPEFQDFLAALDVADWQTDAVSDAEKLIEASGKLCYMSFDTKLNKNLTKTGGRNNYEYIQDGILKTKHGSVIEHATVTLAFLNVSRIVTHELVRHRAGAAYSQVSGRYVRTDQIGYYLPTDIAKNPEAAQVFHEMFSQMESGVRKLEGIFDIGNLKDFSLKKVLTSAFRRIIGNGQTNHIICTFNHRALRHMLEMRTSPGAEEEIRVAFNQVFEILRDRYPALYGDSTVHNDGTGINAVTLTHSKV